MVVRTDVEIRDWNPADLDALPYAADEPVGGARVKANERLTATTGIVLLLLFAAEGATILLGVKAVMPAHVFIGLLVAPPVLLKVSTTGYRFVRYYVGDPAFIDRGPPMWVLRLVAPLLVVSTVVLLVSGVLAVMNPPLAWAEDVHKTSVFVWVGLVAIHVLGHLRETPAKAAADWRPGDAVAGRSTRALAVLAALALGVVLGLWSLTWPLPY